MNKRNTLNNFEAEYLKKGWERLSLKRKPKKFTFNMFEYIYRNHDFKTDDELSGEMLKLFNIKINRNTIKVYRNYLGLNKNKRGQILYKKGIEQTEQKFEKIINDWLIHTCLQDVYESDKGTEEVRIVFPAHVKELLSKLKGEKEK